MMKNDSSHELHEMAASSPAEKSKTGRIRKIRGMLSNKKKKRHERKINQVLGKEPLLSSPATSPVPPTREIATPPSNPFDVERNMELEFEEARVTPSPTAFMVPNLQHETMPDDVSAFYDHERKKETTNPFETRSSINATRASAVSHDTSLFEIEGNQQELRELASSSGSNDMTEFSSQPPTDMFARSGKRILDDEYSLEGQDMDEEESDSERDVYIDEGATSATTSKRGKSEHHQSTGCNEEEFKSSSVVISDDDKEEEEKSSESSSPEESDDDESDSSETQSKSEDSVDVHISQQGGVGNESRRDRLSIGITASASSIKDESETPVEDEMWDEKAIGTQIPMPVESQPEETETESTTDRDIVDDEKVQQQIDNDSCNSLTGQSVTAARVEQDRGPLKMEAMEDEAPDTKDEEDSTAAVSSERRDRAHPVIDELESENAPSAIADVDTPKDISLNEKETLVKAITEISKEAETKRTEDKTPEMPELIERGVPKVEAEKQAFSAAPSSYITSGEKTEHTFPKQVATSAVVATTESTTAKMKKVEARGTEENPEMLEVIERDAQPERDQKQAKPQNEVVTDIISDETKEHPFLNQVEKAAIDASKEETAMLIDTISSAEAHREAPHLEDSKPVAEKVTIDDTLSTTFSSSDDSSSRSSPTSHFANPRVRAAAATVLGSSNDALSPSSSDDEGYKLFATDASTPSAGDAPSHPPFEETLKTKNHVHLKAFEERRRTEFSEKLQAASTKWLSCVDVMNSGLQETARAHRLVLGVAHANQAYGEAMQQIYEDVYLDDEGNILGNSMVGYWRQTRLSEERSHKDYTVVMVQNEGAWRDSLDTPEERRGGMLTSLIDAQSVISRRFEESAKKESTSARQASTLTNHQQELKSRLRRMDAKGKGIIAELEGAESKVASAWDFYVRVYGEALILPSLARTPERKLTPPASPDHPHASLGTALSSLSKLSPKSPMAERDTRDLWLAEMRYRVAVKLQSELWNKVSPELLRLADSVTTNEAGRQSKLQDLLSEYLPQQVDLLSGFDSVHSPVLQELVERQMDQEVDTHIHETIQKHSKRVQMKEAQHKSSILNRSRRTFIPPEVKDLEALESPLTSELIFSMKVVEQRRPSKTWQKVLAVVTVDSYLHLFEIPQSLPDSITAEEVFHKLEPAPLSDIYDWPPEADKDKLKDVTPLVSVLLSKCSIVVSKEDDREFEVVQSRVGRFIINMETTLALRTSTTEETAEWIDTKLEPKTWKKSDLETLGEKEYVVV